MNLTKFLEDSDVCRELRQRVIMFLVEVKPNLITTFACPVCGEDLRQTYQQGLTIFRGNCNCCKLGIQMNHRIVHEGHEGCDFMVRFPVALADRQLRDKLRKAWLRKHGHVLVSLKDESDKVDLDDWIRVAQEIQETHNQARRMV